MLAIRHLKNVVKKTVFLIPQSYTVLATVTHGLSDVDEVFPEFAGDIFVSGVVLRELKSDCQQVQCIHPHPAGAVCLLEETPGRKRSATIEDANIVEAKEPTLENIHALGILAVDPP